MLPWKVSLSPARPEIYDQSFAKRARHQRDRLDHCVAGFSRGRFCLGKIQGTPAQVWPESGGLRFLSVHRYARKLWRVQPEQFSIGNALFSEEPRLHGGAAIDL